MGVVNADVECEGVWGSEGAGEVWGSISMALSSGLDGAYGVHVYESDGEYQNVRDIVHDFVCMWMKLKYRNVFILRI